MLYSLFMSGNICVLPGRERAGKKKNGGKVTWRENFANLEGVIFLKIMKNWYYFPFFINKQAVKSIEINILKFKYEFIIIIINLNLIIIGLGIIIG